MSYFHYTHDNQYIYNLQGRGTAQLDISYGNTSMKNKLDLYLPVAGTAPYPVIIYIHGGGFMQGDKSHHVEGILHGLERGYAVACINYRLNEEAVYPAFIQDVCEGIRFLKANASVYALDPQRFALWGDTHGGTIAAMVAIMGSKGMFDAFPTEYPGTDLKVCGTVSFYAPIDLAEYHKTLNMEKRPILTKDGSLSDEKTFGKKGKELMDLLQQISPLQYVDGTEAPFYLLHGAADFIQPQKMIRKFALKLAEFNVPYVFNYVTNGQHGIDSYDNEKDNDAVMSFFDYVFRK